MRPDTSITKQMLETGNYKSIKFQNTLRSKKPVGVYWLQAIAVNIFSQEVFNEDSDTRYNKIWKYRFISSYSPFSCLALYLLALKYLLKKSFSRA